MHYILFKQNLFWENYKPNSEVTFQDFVLVDVLNWALQTLRDALDDTAS